MEEQYMQHFFLSTSQFIRMTLNVLNNDVIWISSTIKHIKLLHDTLAIKYRLPGLVVIVNRAGERSAKFNVLHSRH